MVNNMIKVKSSNIKRLGYDNETKTCFIEWKSGIYGFKDVPEETFMEFLFSDSKGKFYNKNIRLKKTV